MKIFKNLIFIGLLLTSTAKASRCPFTCYIFDIGPDGGRMLGDSSQFRQREGEELISCRHTVMKDGAPHLLIVQELLEGEFSLQIKKGSELVLSSHFKGNYGSLSYHQESIRFSCVK